jgi:hypothetical protein
MNGFMDVLPRNDEDVFAEEQQEPEHEGVAQRVRTLVMSLVVASISLSSAVRSVNPGRTCLACRRSNADTGEMNNNDDANDE